MSDAHVGGLTSAKVMVSLSASVFPWAAQLLSMKSCSVFPDPGIVPTVLLLKSLGMARYTERNMPHLYIPPEIIDRIQRAPDKVRECVRIAVELTQRIKAEGFPGVVLSTLGWEHKLPEIVEAI